MPVLAIQIITLLIQESPEIITMIQTLLNGQQLTVEQLNALTDQERAAHDNLVAAIAAAK